MSSGLLVFLIAVGVVAFFVVGMSLTLIFKGHYIDSEIGDNKHMKARGIRCTSQEMRREEALLRGDVKAAEECLSDCGSCTLGSCENQETKTKKQA